MLLLVAFVAAYLLWYALAGQRREETAVRSFKAPLTLVNIPRDLVITSSVPDTVAVQVRGPLSGMFESRAPLEVLLDLSDARPGLHTYAIADNEIQLPPEVTLVSVDPAEVILEFERLETVVLPVQATIEGAPAPGFVLGEVRVAPAQLPVQGPSSLVGALDHVETAAVSVEGATAVVEATVHPQLPPPLRSLTALPLLVVVEVTAEPIAEQTPTP
jgi:YbbR domain-containing protein